MPHKHLWSWIGIILISHLLSTLGWAQSQGVFSLIDASSNVSLQSINENDTLIIPLLQAGSTTEKVWTISLSGTSYSPSFTVDLELTKDSNPNYHSKTEGSSPYSLYGDRDRGPVLDYTIPASCNIALTPGAYTLSATSKEVGAEPLTRSFIVKRRLADFQFIRIDDPISGNIVSFIGQVNDTTGRSNEICEEISPIVRWSWDFGDGSTSTELNPSHRYPGPGTYLITLEVEDASGKTDMIRKQVSISDGPNESPLASFRWEIADSTTVSFIDESTDPDGTITEWLWSFGDGVFNTSQSLNHTYLEPGSYLVILEVTDNQGAKDTTQQIVTIPRNIPPVAAFNAIVEGRQVQYFDASVDVDGTIESWLWDFGDANTSTEQNPMHIYEDTGSYTVVLTVTDDDDVTATRTQQIRVRERESSSLVAAFNAYSENLTVTFSDQSAPQESVDAWLWEFGDGSTSTEQNPVYQYTDSGMYAVVLTITDANGMTSMTSQLISVQLDNLGPTALFTWEQSGRTVSFLDESSDPDGTIVQWNWDFGDGTSSTEQEPTHSYEDPGSYLVKLVVTDSRGATGIATARIVIRIEGNQPPIAAFNAFQTGLLVRFSDVSFDLDGTITNWFWEFGDGNTSTTQNPVYRYSEEGTYTVRLSVSDNEGSEGVTELELDVTQVPQATGPIAAFGVATDGLTARFTDLSVPDTSLVSRVWNFGDGATSMDQNPVHTFQDTGTYLVTLTITDNTNLSNTFNQEVRIIENNQGPLPAFTWVRDGLTVSFEDLSTDADGSIESWFWNFDDGATDTSQNPVHEFPAPGDYRVVFIVTDDAGATGSTVAIISIPDNTPPVAAFKAVIDGLNVQFADASIDPDGIITEWTWDLGDGTITNTPSPVHTYEAEGIYSVGLTVVDDGGASSSTRQEIEVNDVLQFQLPAQVLTIGGQDSVRVDLNDFFQDPSGMPLSFVVSSADDQVATAEMNGNTLLVVLRTTDPEITGDSTEILIEVIDPQEKVFISGFTVFVNRSPIVAPPVQVFEISTFETTSLPNTIFEVSLAEETGLNQFQVGDPDGDVLTCTIMSSNSNVARVESSADNACSGAFTVEPLSFGQAEISLYASDGRGGRGVAGFEIAVSQLAVRSENEVALLDEPLRVEVTLSGGEVRDVQMNYRIGGNTQVFSVDGASTSDSTYVFEVPSEDVTARGLEYWLEVFQLDETAYSSGRSTVQVRIGGRGLTASLGAVPVVPREFSLFSVPLQLDTTSIISMMEDDLGPYVERTRDRSWRLFEFLSLSPDSGIFVEPDPSVDLKAEPGKAYWITTKEVVETFTTGSAQSVPTVTDEPFDIVLRSGWNLIGNPFLFDVPIENMCQTATDPARQDTLEFYQYDANNEERWSVVHTLETFGGYAVFSTVIDTLSVYPFEPDTGRCGRRLVPSQDTQAEAASRLWSIDIVAQNESERKDRSVAAVISNALKTWDGNDKPVRPVPGNYLAVRFTHPGWEGLATAYWQDARPQPEEGEVWDFEVVSSNSDRITLTFEGVESVPAHFQVTLLDPVTGITQDLRTDTEYVLGSASEHSPRVLKLIVGNRVFQEEQLRGVQGVPTEFGIAQNFPNPFQQSTTVPYQLPQSEFVSVAVYDMLGRRVAALMQSEEHKAGRHVVVWDGRNDAGQTVASGLYFVHIQAGSFSGIRKMMMVR